MGTELLYKEHRKWFYENVLPSYKNHVDGYAAFSSMVKYPGSGRLSERYELPRYVFRHRGFNTYQNAVGQGYFFNGAGSPGYKTSIGPCYT